MTETDATPIFYPDLGDLSTPEPGNAEGLTLKLYEYTKKRDASSNIQDIEAR